MQPERAARFLAQIGAAVLLLVIGLRGYSLLAQLNRPASPAQANTDQPYLGSYQFSPSGAQVSFEQGRLPPGQVTPGDDARLEPFWLDLASGAVTPGGLPEPDLTPFVLRRQRLFLLVGEGYSLVAGSPPALRVDPASLARSPNQKAMAFAAEDPGTGNSVLAVLLSSGPSYRVLAEGRQILTPGWSPDGQNLTFTMQASPGDSAQVYRVSLNGGEPLALTSGPGERRLPRWSPDGQRIAFLQSDPQPGGITIIPAEGGEPARLETSGGDPDGLVWAGGPRTLAYHAQSASWPTVRELYLVDAQSGFTRRAYPQLSIDRLECPPNLPVGGRRAVQVTLSNGGPRAVLFRLVLRTGAAPLPPLDRASQANRPTPPPNQAAAEPESPPQPRASASRSQTLALNPGQSQTVEWPPSAAFGLETYISARIDQSGQSAVVERHCVIPNTYLGMPNLPYLPVTLPLAAIGTVLCIPWLRHQKKQLAWLLLVIVWILIAGLIYVEWASVTV